MVRQRNPQRRHTIAAAAEGLFVAKGYRATSYSDIAREAELDRSLVQYYFPRKAELVANFVNRVLLLAEGYIAERGEDRDDGYTVLYRIGQVYFSFLVHDAAMRALTLDVVSDREITSELVFLNETWAAGFLGTAQAPGGEFSEDFDLVVGGAYELCYRHLARGESVDVEGLVERMLFAFMVLAGQDAVQSRETLARARLESDVVAGFVARLGHDLTEAGQ